MRFLPIDIGKDVHVHTWLCKQQAASQALFSLCELALQQDEFDCFVYLGNYASMPIRWPTSHRHASQTVPLPYLRFFHMKNWGRKCMDYPFTMKILQLECLVYGYTSNALCDLEKNGIRVTVHTLEGFVCQQLYGVSWGRKPCANAITGKSFAAFYYAAQHGALVADSKEECRAAAHTGLFYLKYLRKIGCDWNSGDCIAEAAGAGAADCLQFMYQNFPNSICDLRLVAAESGSMRYLGMSLSIPILKKIKTIYPAVKRNFIFCGNAAWMGSLELLRYLHEQGYPWNCDTCDWAARNGSLECLQYAFENGCPMGRDTATFAASQGSLQCMRYALLNGSEMSEHTAAAAAGAGSLSCLRYLYQRSCAWDEDTCAEAAKAESLLCLRFAHENGCPWDEDTCAAAAATGSFACLKYAHENGCPWDEDTCAAAAVTGSFVCLKYAHENGCPWDEYTYYAVMTDFHPECTPYVCSNVPPETQRAWLSQMTKSSGR